jgi:hypothetical protein
MAELLEIAEGLHRAGLMKRADYAKITARRAGRKKRPQT